MRCLAGGARPPPKPRRRTATFLRRRNFHQSSGRGVLQRGHLGGTPGSPLLEASAPSAPVTKQLGLQPTSWTTQRDRQPRDAPPPPSTNTGDCARRATMYQSDCSCSPGTTAARDVRPPCRAKSCSCARYCFYRLSVFNEPAGCHSGRLARRSVVGRFFVAVTNAALEIGARSGPAKSCLKMLRL